MRGINLSCIALVAATAVSIAHAGNKLDQIDDLGQSQFEVLSEDLGSALAYRSVSPAEPLGITGFDIGMSITAVQLEGTQAWETAVGDSDFSSTLYVPKIHAVKGLPLGIDVGAFYTSVPSTNIKLWGAEVKYAIWEGGVVTPALSIRGSYTTLSGVDQLSFSTAGLDLSISKGFTLLTPYAGIGIQRVDSRPEADAAVVLDDEKFTQNRLFAGMNINLGLLNTALELDKTGDASSYSLKLGFRF